MFVPIEPGSERFPYAFRLVRGTLSELRFWTTVDYAVDWCVDNLGKSGTRWRVQKDTMMFATQNDALHFADVWVRDQEDA